MIISGKCFVVICPFCFIEENPPNQRRIAKLKETGTRAFYRERNLKNHEERTLRPPAPPKPVSYSVRLLLQFEVKLATGRGGDWQINDKIHSYLTHDVDLESMGVDNFAVILLLNYRKRRGPWIFRPCWQNGKMKSPRMWHTWTSGPGGWHQDRTG